MNISILFHFYIEDLKAPLLVSFDKLQNTMISREYFDSWPPYLKYRNRLVLHSETPQPL